LQNQEDSAACAGSERKVQVLTTCSPKVYHTSPKVLANKRDVMFDS